MGLLLLYVCARWKISFLIFDPQGNDKMGVRNGVSRDVYISYWTEAANSLLAGEIE